MKNRVLFPSAVLLILIAVYTLTNCRTAREGFAAKGQNQNAKSPFAASTNPQSADSSATGGNPAAEQDFSEPIDFSKRRPEIRSLHSMTNLLAQSLQPDFSMEDVMRRLREENQDPTVKSDDNGVTGEMSIIRTNNPFSGLRYFHAQYFSNGDGTRYVQHMSFEYRPGPQAMSDAIESIKKNFPGLGKPLFNEANSVRWALPGGYMIEATRLDAEDIRQDDPYNTYDASDVGTIWIALQLDETDHGAEDTEE